MGELSPWHWLIVAIVFVALFGSAKLPVAARSVGRSMRIFKAEIKGNPADGHGGEGDILSAAGDDAQARQIRAARLREEADRIEHEARGLPG